MTPYRSETLDMYHGCTLLTLFLTYKTNIITYRINISTISYLFLHIPATIHHHQQVYSPIYFKHNKIYIYDSNIYHISVISVAKYIKHSKMVHEYCTMLGK